MTSRKLHAASWIAQLAAAAILLQTLFYKFTAHPSSVEIFSELGLEPRGRIAIGALELVASVLLLLPATAAYGALLAAGLMCGALAGHATRLGWAGDRLSLAGLAVVVLACSAFVIAVRRKDFLRFVEAARRKT